MAVIQYSALVTQLRGKLGGSQFNKGHAGYSLQRKSTPVIRQSEGQLAQRQIMSRVQREWKELPEADRIAWGQAAQANPTRDRFGQQVVLSGYNHYVKTRCWFYKWGIGQPQGPVSSDIVTTPRPPIVLSLSNVVLSSPSYVRAGVSALSISADYLATPSGGYSVSQMKAFYYLTLLERGGRPVHNQRTMFYRRGAWAAGGTVIVTGQQYYGEPFMVGDLVLLEVRSRNVNAGAETGYWSEAITIQ